MAHEPSFPKKRVAAEGETTTSDPPQVQEADVEVRAETSRDASSTLPGVIEISGLPSFTESMFDEARAAKEHSNEGAHGADDPLRSFFEGVDSTIVEDFSGLGDLEVPRKDSSLEVGGLNSSPKLINQFLAPSNDPAASVLHHESFLWYRVEANQLEAEVRELAEKRDMYKLLSEQSEKGVKSLWVELDTAQKEHADLVEHVKIFEVSDDDLDMATNDQTSQVQQKVDGINQLRAEMNEVKAMAEGWKGKMDRLASEKETAQEQLASVEVQLRVAREKSKACAQQIQDPQSQLGSTIAKRDALGKDLEIARSVWEITRSDAEEMVAEYRVDVEAA
ncbi:uncharacterized protein [Nicotiana tomentosiformis]|uniref:uncharacterized protein n=1 Tax=Nicotiana tomentosiformis TaxID=4098 RepID=UPI00388C8F70